MIAQLEYSRPCLLKLWPDPARFIIAELGNHHGVHKLVRYLRGSCKVLTLVKVTLQQKTIQNCTLLDVRVSDLRGQSRLSELKELRYLRVISRAARVAWW